MSVYFAKYFLQNDELNFVISTQHGWNLFYEKYKFPHRLPLFSDVHRDSAKSVNFLLTHLRLNIVS